ncbi:c-type cytochrome [Psychromarinibacter sp. S121]|uniref:c-type cytochrome n=1 Tax=Psychromarinibacter sp. S121 TaxID=3415127 RepID=UPI003C7C0DB0
MKRLANSLLAASLLAAPATAQDLSDEAAYAADSFGQCATCHVIADDSGEVMYGKRGKVGPNLHCVIGRTAGTYDGFRYGKSMEEAGEAGLVWDAENLVTYLQDPKAYLAEFLDDPRARSKMTFKVRADKGEGKSEEEVAAAFAALLAETCAN